MPTSAEVVLFDTSAAVALVSPDSPFNASARAASRDRRRGLSGHAYAEFISVLTRLPPGERVTGPDALLIATTTFPESRFLPEDRQQPAIATMVGLGIVGGAVYDGLVASAAAHHGLRLLSADVRARGAYQALGVDVQFLSAS